MDVHAGCGFVAGIHLPSTWMSGSFESVQWNACMHRLDLSLSYHLEEFLGNGVIIYVNTKGKSPLLEVQRRIEPTTLHHAGLQAQHTTHWAIRVLYNQLFHNTCARSHSRSVTGVQFYNTNCCNGQQHSASGSVEITICLFLTWYSYR